MKRLKWFLDTLLLGCRLMFDPIGMRDKRLESIHKKFQQCPQQADGEALASDWIAVGNDMRRAMTEYGRTAAKHSTAR